MTLTELKQQHTRQLIEAGIPEIEARKNTEHYFSDPLYIKMVGFKMISEVILHCTNRIDNAVQNALRELEGAENARG